MNTKFEELDLNQYCNVECILSKSVIKDIENNLFIMYHNKWHSNLLANENSKLLTYRLFQSNYCTDKYLSITMPGKYKNAYAKYRAGVAPIRIETGRFEGIDANKRF